MIIVDDCSIDGSYETALSYVQKDKRIKVFRMDKNNGAAACRNKAIELSKGRYLAFLDSDDLWLPKKLEKQLAIFEKDNVMIVYSNYEKITEAGVRNDRIIISPKSTTYHQLLKGNCIGWVTSIYDTAKGGTFEWQRIGHEDYAYWLSMMQDGYIAKNTNTVEALYRVRDNSISKNKRTASAWTWNIYRKFLKLTFIQSLYYFCFYFFNAMRKYIK
jgi:glycosyltransferase involved in cell wall biosynthesis